MNIINTTNAVILDTETTGLSDDDEMVQIAIIDAETGELLINQLLKPKILISKSASNIHGITNSSVSNCVEYNEIHNDIINIISGKTILAYNLEFDVNMLYQTAFTHNCDLDSLENSGLFSNNHCIMEWYAEFYGDYNDYFDSYTWQRLDRAAVQQRIDISDLKTHDAFGDCEITRRLIHKVNSKLD
jgi:DNA polymerase-3 subunit epsilon